MYIDSRKVGAARPMVIGSDQLNFVSYYTYLGHKKLSPVMICLMNLI